MYLRLMEVSESGTSVIVPIISDIFANDAPTCNMSARRIAKNNALATMPPDVFHGLSNIKTL